METEELKVCLLFSLFLIYAYSAFVFNEIKTEQSNVVVCIFLSFAILLLNGINFLQ